LTPVQGWSCRFSIDGLRVSIGARGAACGIGCLTGSLGQAGLVLCVDTHPRLAMLVPLHPGIRDVVIVRDETNLERKFGTVYRSTIPCGSMGAIIASTVRARCPTAVVVGFRLGSSSGIVEAVGSGGLVVSGPKASAAGSRRTSGTDARFPNVAASLHVVQAHCRHSRDRLMPRRSQSELPFVHRAAFSSVG